MSAEFEAGFRAGREAMREEAARVALDWATDRAGQGFPGHEDMAQMGDAIRALPLVPVEATPPATEDDPLPYSFGTGHGRSSTPTPYEGGPTGSLTPRPEFGPTPREGDES